MKTSSAAGRGTARRPRGPAKIIPMRTPKVVKRRRAMQAGIGVVITALLAAIAMRVYLTRNAPRSPEEMAGVSEPESEIIEAVNAERVRRGLKPLKFSPRLAVVARGHSYDMAIRHYRGHDSPEGSTPADRIRGVGVEYAAVAENIYVDDYHKFESLGERALKAWLDSPEHSANLLSPEFVETGIGIARSNDGLTYVTQDFVR
jgi:uncharacterized protein YkwD